MSYGLCANLMGMRKRYIVAWCLLLLVLSAAIPACASRTVNPITPNAKIKTVLFISLFLSYS